MKGKISNLCVGVLLSFLFWGCAVDTVTTSDKSTPPHAPDEIVFYDKTSFSMKVSWDESDPRGLLKDGKDAEILYYELQYSVSRDFENTKSLYVSGTDTIIRKLKAASNYYVRVRAKNNNKEGLKSMSDFGYLKKGPSFETAELSNQENPPDIPKRIAVYGILSRSAKVSWLPPLREGRSYSGATAEISHYVVSYSLDENFEHDLQIKIKDGTTGTVLRGLHPDSKYYVRVKAVNNNPETKNTSGFRNFESGFHTLGETGILNRASPPGRPLNVSTRDASAISARILWDVPEEKGTMSSGSIAGILKYEVEYSTSEDFKGSIAVVSMDTSAIIDGLKPQTAYYVRVRAVNNSGVIHRDSSEFTVLKNVFVSLDAASKPSPPYRIFATGVTPKVATINWIEPLNKGVYSNGNASKIVSYIFEYSISPEFSSVVSGIYETTSVSLRGLHQDTEYHVRIKSVNDGNGISEYGFETFRTGK